jgi:L-glyceraldehyde 3-phosphate reductase
MKTHKVKADRYDKMNYKRCGNSGLLLPVISLGLWHNFGDVDEFSHYRKILLNAFDAGITHFDLANNYGPPPGSAEKNFGKIIRKDLKKYRDEIIVSTKAGHLMWPGPYGEWGSRKSLLASLDQSLKRMKLDYVDIFYSHCPDPNTPLEETMLALDQAVRQGKALYAGISKYDAERTIEAGRILNELKTPYIIYQASYSMLNREIEIKHTDIFKDKGIGCIAFSPLAQGLLTDKYLKGIPENSRAAKESGFLRKDQVSKEIVEKAHKLIKLAAKRGQSLAQMALAWVMRLPEVTSVLIGASSVAQLNDNLAMLNNKDFSDEELNLIEKILK